MNLLVLENQNVDSIDLKFKDIPEASILRVNPNTYYDVLKRAGEPPVLTACWLVYLSSRLSREQRNEILRTGNNINVIKTYSKGEFNSIKVDMLRDEIDFKVYDMTHIPKPEAEKFVRDSLGVDDNLAIYICKRHHYYFPKICESVSVLKTVDNLNKAKVNKYTESKNVYITDVVDAILGVPGTVKSKQKACSCVYDFRYAIKYLLKEISKGLDIYFYAFNLIVSGYLSLDNYKSVVEEDSVLRNVAPYRVQHIIENFRYVSMERVCCKQIQVGLINPKRTELYKILQLIWEVD